MSARKRTELTLRDKASAGKSHRQLGVESDDDDTSDSLSVNFCPSQQTVVQKTFYMFYVQY